MAGASLLALLDDIATLLDDISVMTKVAVKKTAGVLGDDLALNAEQVSGVRAERELPVVWAVAKGSMLNKAILVPAALLINAVMPWLVLPLLMVGGAYLCFEGIEKVFHHLFAHGKADPAQRDKQKKEKLRQIADRSVDLVALERTRIKGAIRTDFILSAEIIVITLGVVKTNPFLSQLAVLSTIAIGMTVGVYGLVAAIVKLDDGGQLCVERSAGHRNGWYFLGMAMLGFAPRLMKFLAFAGTVAMFTVGGSILLHGVPGGEALLQGAEALVPGEGLLAATLQFVAPVLVTIAAGMAAGALVLAAVTLVKRVWRPGQ